MLVLRSPAKINLFLKVVGRRSDGYHNLSSLFQTIDLTDTIHLELCDDDHLTCTDPEIPTDGRNLILKAASLLRKKTGLHFSVRAHLEKQIPHQAGLGGGSGNAATTLWGLNQLLGMPATVEELIAWSLEIGADVPFFFSRGSAHCTGIGEIISDQPTPNLKQPFWVVKPKFGLSTPEVFKKLNLNEISKTDPELALGGFLQGKPTYFNDLEIPALQLTPDLAEIKMNLLASGFDAVVMTGSGSGLFCVGHGTIPDHLFQRQVKFINRSADCWY